MCLDLASIDQTLHALEPRDPFPVPLRVRLPLVPSVQRDALAVDVVSHQELRLHRLARPQRLGAGFETGVPAAGAPDGGVAERDGVGVGDAVEGVAECVFGVGFDVGVAGGGTVGEGGRGPEGFDEGKVFGGTGCYRNQARSGSGLLHVSNNLMCLPPKRDGRRGLTEE